jgi:hypothetical protein
MDSLLFVRSLVHDFFEELVVFVEKVEQLPGGGIGLDLIWLICQSETIKAGSPD